MPHSSRFVTWAKRLATAIVLLLTVAILVIVAIAGVVLGGPPMPRP